MKNLVIIELVVAGSLLGGVVLELEKQRLNDVTAKQAKLLEVSNGFREYSRRLNTLAKSLVTEQRTLAQAVAELNEARCQTGHEPLGYLRCYYPFDDVASCLACQLCNSAAHLVSELPETERHRHHDRLACEFSQYQPQLPKKIEDIFSSSE
jgi:hypothetical protein